MSTSWDSSGISFLMSNSNLTLTEIMDIGFVDKAHGSSSPCSRTEQWDLRTCPKSGGSPFLVKVSESTPLISGEKQRLTAEDILPYLGKSPLPADSQVFDLSSLASEPLNNSVVGVFYGAKVSTPYKEEQLETNDSASVKILVPRLQDLEMVVQTVEVQKPASPMWELSEIKSVLEDNTPNLDVSISDLRYTNGSEHDLSPNPQVPPSCAQWVGITHKDVGRSFLQPFRFQRQLSASEIPVSSNTPLVHAFHQSADELGGEWQLEITT